MYQPQDKPAFCLEEKMYTKEQLSKYPYFEEVLRTRDISNVIDSLTGLVSRRHMVGFIQHLVENRVPFTLALLDLDNFKFINDTYGHHIGDGVLTGVSNDMERYLEDYGIAGRYGGDEFLIVNFRDHQYDEIKGFFTGFYSDYHVLRKNIDLGECEPFITGTIGSAIFPEDAQDYTSLFSLVDKALYRGKTKGRNCYIIYVEEKHKDITIRELAGKSIYTTFRNLSSGFDARTELPDKLKAMLEVLADDMRISDLYYVGMDHQFRSVRTGEVLGKTADLDQLIQEDLYTTNEIGRIEGKAPNMHALCRAREFETVLMTRIGIRSQTYGYLVCAEPRNRRIWQDEEYAVLFFAARMLAGYMQNSGMNL